MIVIESIFWICMGAVIHSYILYPLLLRVLAAGKEANKVVYETTAELPPVSILIAAHNEEAVIAEKITSIFSGTYPAEKTEVLIGSDNSSDRTNEIVKNLRSKYPGLL